MIILGIDPGLSLCGWGLVESGGQGSLSMLAYGCIKTKPSESLTQRLTNLHLSITNLIRENRPDEMAIEEIFFSKEARTVASVGQARGAILAAAGVERLPVYEYNPRSIKMAMTGFGSADKSQMQKMVKTVLRLAEIPKPDDAADALAIAMCHINTKKMSSIFAGNNK
jgi:crossover junction endodeoxyribonuclease RuvC